MTVSLILIPSQRLPHFRFSFVAHSHPRCCAHSVVLHPYRTHLHACAPRFTCSHDNICFTVQSSVADGENHKSSAGGELQRARSLARTRSVSTLVTPQTVLSTDRRFRSSSLRSTARESDIHPRSRRDDMASWEAREAEHVVTWSSVYTQR